MSAVEEIKQAVDKLSFQGRCELMAMLTPPVCDEWDQQMTQGSEAGGKLPSAGNCAPGFSMSGITFMIDSQGKKTAAVIDLRRHAKVWEDFFDTILAESRAQEPRESFASVKRRLKLRKTNG